MQGGTGNFQGQFLCYAPPFFYTKQGLDNRVKHLLSQAIPVNVPRVERWIDRFIVSTGLQLSLLQQQAVVMAASHRVLILSGGPSTGKSFICKTIVALRKALGRTITLASPISRVAQCLSEMTGQEAKTLHRLLEIDPKIMKFKRDQDNRSQLKRSW